MARIRPFCGVFYDDPTDDAGDGVLDVSGVIDATSRSDIRPSNVMGSDAWQRAFSDGFLRADDHPALYLVRVGWRDVDDRPWQRSGVIGLAERPESVTTVPSTSVVSDAAFADLLVPDGVPLVRATDHGGRHYRLWAIRGAGVIDTIADAVERLAPSPPSALVLATTDHFELPAGLVFAPPDA